MNATLECSITIGCSSKIKEEIVRKQWHNTSKWKVSWYPAGGLIDPVDLSKATVAIVVCTGVMESR